MSPESLDSLVRHRFPSFLAHAYERWADADEPAKRLHWALRWQDLLTRLLTLVATQQYLLVDRDTHSDPRLNQLLLQRFPLATPDIWSQLLFALLEAYEDQREDLFMPELHRLAWTPVTTPSDSSSGFKRRRDLQGHLDRLVQIGLELRHPGAAESPDHPTLAEEASRLLELLLPDVAFLAEYLVAEGADNESQAPLIHQGLASPRGWDRDLKPPAAERVVLYRQDGESLPLHPLAVPGDAFSAAPEEIGLYHRFNHHSLRFLLALSGTESAGEQWTSAFVQLLFDSIRRVKQSGQRTDFLTWWHLKEVTQDITQARTASARSRYSRRLYLPRRQVQEAFEAFLASSQRCFVLLGPSGVGKSSFLLHFEERIREGRDDLAMLIYEGGNLDPDLSVSALITQDLRDRVSFETDGDDPIWARLEQLEGAAAQEGRMLLLCIDGLNECPNAAAVLQHLDQVVRRPWSSLKVIITSRPETWRAIRRGLRLAEALYFQPAASADSLPGPFEASARLQPFSAEELPRVFAAYREAYDLATSNEDLLQLPPDQRRLLCEPLNLALAARNNRGGALPEAMGPQTLIRDHLGSLHREGVLAVGDLEFLEHRLMPRFAAHGDWTNVLRPEDLDLPEQPELFEAVFSDQELANGRSANQNFRNLVDSALLIRREQGGAPEIVFRYERFFEYFAARHLQRSIPQEARPERYLQLIRRLEHQPFLWGALRLALLAELEEGHLGMVLELCRSPLPQARSLALKALEDVDTDRRLRQQRAETVVDRVLEELLPRFRWSRDPLASSSAVELAGRTERLQPLLRAALQSSGELRRHAVYHSYLLWRRHPERGLALLESLTAAATRGWLPRPGPLEAVASLALLIFFDSRDKPETGQRLRQLWRRLCRHLLRVKVAEGEAPWRTAVRRLRTEMRLRLLAKLLMRLISEFPDGNAFNRQDLTRSLPVPPEQAELYRRILSHHWPDRKTSFEEVRRDLLAASSSEHLLVGRATALVLMVWLNYDPERWHPVMGEILRRAQERNQPSQWIDLVCLAGGLTLDHRNHHSDDLYQVFTRALDAYQGHYRDHPRIQPMERDYSRHNYFGGDILFYYLRTGEAVSPVLRRHLQRAAEHRDPTLFHALLARELIFVAVHSRRPAAAFDALEEILHRIPEALHHELEEPIRRLLESIHRFFPEEVERFVQERPDLEALALDLRSLRRPWNTGAVFGWKCARFLRDNLLMESSEIRRRIVGILEQATRCRELSAWLDYAVREAVNVAYGADVLPQRQPRAQEGAQP